MTYISITKWTNKALDFFKEIASRANKHFGTQFAVQREIEIPDRDRYSVFEKNNSNVSINVDVLPAYPPKFPLSSVNVRISVTGMDERFALQTITEFCRKIAIDYGDSIVWVGAEISIEPPTYYTINYTRDLNERAFFDRLQVYHKELIHGEPFVIYAYTLPHIKDAIEVIWDNAELEELGAHKKISVGFKLFVVPKKPEMGCIGLVGKALNPPHGLMIKADTYDELQAKIRENLEKRGLRLITDLVALIAASKSVNEYGVEWK